ncbi:speckle-type poz [Fusarium albosuccineum]|uniref:Speckle-type poz n=1 Tax=Fusarium albosuccineum TaxID=1237068 RepID=A0A8H4L134_9HYPO|nr:speckle-type poz [Fusarium albosuccineum]
MTSDESKNALMASIKQIFKTGSYSDLTIVCGTDRHKVHKAIICPRSKFFASACDSKFQESQTGVINLPEDDPLTVKLMLHYLYHQDYSHEPPAGTDVFKPYLAPVIPVHVDAARDISPRMKKRMRSTIPPPTPPPMPTTVPNLPIHVKVYALAEKYAIEDLKAVALKKFRIEAKEHWQSQDFIDAIQEVYTSTVDSDRGLRDVLVGIICLHMELLDRPSFQDAVKDHRLTSVSSHGPGLVAVFGAFNYLMIVSHDKANRPPLVIAVGGTSGIGESTAREFVRYASSPRVYLVGRSREQANRIENEFQQLNPSSRVQFIQSDVSQLRNVDKLCEKIKAQEEKINFLFLTAGIFHMRGREGNSCFLVPLLGPY